ncbi:MAG: FAD-dependent monooxygenase [Terriglobales bacterium]
MSSQFDIAVIGGGPAGTAAAITAALAGSKVLLLDRDSFPRAKVCGEFVSAESLALLGRLLGEAHPLLTETAAIAAGRLFLGGSITETHIEPFARSIPRYELDHALWQAAEAAGASARSGESVAEVQGDGPFTIVTEKGKYEARALINASGRWSGVLRALQAPAGQKWIGIKAHYAAESAAKTVDLYFFRRGYCGVQPVSEGVLNVCAMVRSDVATSLEEVMEQHSALQMRSLEWSRVTEPVVTAPLLHEPPTPLTGQVLNVGDAAGFIDPFLGDGISLALQTGARAAEALAPFIQGAAALAQAADNYAEGYRRDVEPAFRNAARLRRMLAIAEPFPPAVAGLLKIPHITEWFLRKTRPKMAVGE